MATTAHPRFHVASAAALAVLVLLAMVVVPVSAAKAQSWSHPNFTANGIPTNGEVLFGAATIDDITNLESQVGGPVGIRRSYYKAGQESSAISRAADDIAHGRLPWLSFKLPYGWADMANGRGDAWATDLANRLGQLNGPVWIALHHEPEGDGNHPDWVAMQRHLSPLFRQHDNIAYTIILMGWHQFLSGNTAYSMDTFWPGKENVDVLGFDPYNFYATTRSNGSMNWAWDEMSKYYDGITKWLKNSGNQDVPWAIAETGYSDIAASIPRNYVAPNGKTVSTAGSGADWLTRAYDDMKTAGGVALTYFSVAGTVNNEPSDWTWPITSNPKRTTYANILNRSPHINDRVAEQPGGNPAPSPTPTSGPRLPTASPTPTPSTAPTNSAPTSPSPRAPTKRPSTTQPPKSAVPATAPKTRHATPKTVLVKRTGRRVKVRVTPRGTWPLRVSRWSKRGWQPRLSVQTARNGIRSVTVEAGRYRLTVGSAKRVRRAIVIPSR